MARNEGNVNVRLVQAAIRGSLRDVKVALKAGADIDFDLRYSDKASTGTALFIASQRGHVDIVKLLLREGASVAKRSALSHAPLHIAAFNGETEVVELLVQHGATLDIRDNRQHTPLVHACIFNHVDTVRLLLELGANPDVREAGSLDECEEESLKIVEEAMKTKLLRCCNPKCGKPGYRKTGTLKLCGRCKLTRYCSRDCQIQHWSVGHKKCCGHDAYTGERPDSFQNIMTSVFNSIQVNDDTK
ncbi:protein fem-1 homolog A-like [Branchiostoma floridae]|uniref:Protein fem-1 homolog A-like n=1 Tax=Branchiostoma floridae TaxID=7739 RepID=A0A9J7LHV0_BRAFL|nr:protein fem-1 homolog A-like [Branchiostoma floridae]